jgi:hypothetical protein
VFEEDEGCGPRLGGDLGRPRLELRVVEVGGAQRDAVFAQDGEDFVVLPALVAELDGDLVALGNGCEQRAKFSRGRGATRAAV